LLHLRALLLAVNEVLLAVSARLLAIRALGHGLEISRHLLDRASELGQLLGDARNVLSRRHVAGVYVGRLEDPRAGSIVAVVAEPVDGDGGAAYPAKRRSAIDALCPPKPDEFETATSTLASRASFGM
jgi:hypothetical protein